MMEELEFCTGGMEGGGYRKLLWGYNSFSLHSLDGISMSLKLRVKPIAPIRNVLTGSYTSKSKDVAKDGNAY